MRARGLTAGAGSGMLPAMASRIEVRPVRAGDAEAIWQISREPGVIERILTLPSERLADREASIRDLGPDEHYMVGLLDDVVAGLGGLSVGRGRLRHAGTVFLFVSARHQGRGVGSAILAALLDLADRWLLLERVELTVIVDNEGARKLYERFGFEIEGRRRRSVIADGEMKDEWLMARLRP